MPFAPCLNKFYQCYGANMNGKHLMSNTCNNYKSSKKMQRKIQSIFVIRISCHFDRWPSGTYINVVLFIVWFPGTRRKNIIVSKSKLNLVQNNRQA